MLQEGDAYGYFLGREIGRRSADTFSLKDGTLYPALKRLEQDGLVEGYWGDTDAGGRRRYYRITAAGRAAHQAWMVNWSDFVRSMNAVLGVSQ